MFLFTGGAFLDPRQDQLRHGVEVLVEGDRVREVSDRPITSASATRVHLGGRTLMPGLIDAHVHVFLPELNIARLDAMPLTLLGVQASVFLRRALMRGFTTLRDTGGGDSGIREACRSGLIQAPRLFIAGASISQTGGHADFRSRTQRAFQCFCCSGAAYVSRIADGVPEMIRAARDELRKGADFIKIMVSGGVASESDPLDSLQFRLDEIEAAVEEAERWGTYVAAHAYSARAIERAVKAGVRTIEHGNMIDEPRAALMAERGAYLVANLVAYDAMRRRGAGLGMSEYGQAKNLQVLEHGMRSLEIANRAGVKIGYGSDLLGELEEEQCLEFQLRAQVMPAAEIIRSATIVGAEIVRKPGELGEILPGAYADLLVIEGDPYKDLTLFQDGGPHLAAIMRGGEFVKNRLDG